MVEISSVYLVGNLIALLNDWGWIPFALRVPTQDTKTKKQNKKLRFNPPHSTLSFWIFFFYRCQKFSVGPKKNSTWNALKKILCKNVFWNLLTIFLVQDSDHAQLSPGVIVPHPSEDSLARHGGAVVVSDNPGSPKWRLRSHASAAFSRRCCQSSTSIPFSVQYLLKYSLLLIHCIYGQCSMLNTQNSVLTA